MALTVLVAYDITQDRRRARLAALLQSWGDRIQYSVFICTIADDALPTLEAEVTKMIDVDEDSVFIVRQCKTCWAGLVTIGQGEPPHEDLLWEAF
ncbi:MAG: CRISPR-associated endonuclease Cas2 [Gordonia sp. (in: high G+C Gram-positive bacteria)]